MAAPATAFNEPTKPPAMLVETGAAELLVALASLEVADSLGAAEPLLVSSLFDLFTVLVVVGAVVVIGAVLLPVSLSEVLGVLLEVDATAVSVTVASVDSADVEAAVEEARTDEGFQQERVEVVDTQGSVPL